MIVPDMEAFQAPDGTVITGRVSYERYCKEKGVTNPADYKDQWAKQAEDRAKVFTGGNRRSSESRQRILAENYKEFKTYGEYRQMLENLGRRK